MVERSARVLLRPALVLIFFISILHYGSLLEHFCSDDEFSCLDEGTCVNRSQICDGKRDCANGNDEFNCDFLKCLAPHWFHCANNHCVSASVVCDTENDCGDWSDEVVDCVPLKIPVVPVVCKASEFRCPDNMCIPERWVCDGKPDCPDGSDETVGCTTSLAHCEGFRCDNKECIPLDFRCDGSADCEDMSDERDCEAVLAAKKKKSPKLKDCTLERGYFLCHDGVTCLELSEYCNNKTSCLDGGDEGGLCFTPMCEKAGCSHTCQPTPHGAMCLCPAGWELGHNSTRQCIDIDECGLYGVCDQRCHNLKGTFTCSCDEGYTMDNDRTTCHANGMEGVLVFSSYTEIRMYTLRTDHMARIHRKLKRVTGVAFDGRRVYWSSLEEDEERIMRSREDGSKKEAIVTAGVGMPEDMAWDWVTKKLYFTDVMEKHVAACTGDGHACVVLVNTVTDLPRGIVLAPQDGMMYWTDWGSKPHIARAGMDGSNPAAFITDKMHWPNSVALDYSNKRLYWVDAKLHTLESSRLDGTDRRLVLKMPVSNPFSIALFENRLYWSNADGREIKSCDKFTGKRQRTLVRETKQRILGIHIYHPSLTPELPNPCRLAPCSHLCLLAPAGKYTCACPSGMMMSRDRKTCVEKSKKSYLLVGAGSKLIHLQHQILGRQNFTEIPLQTVYRIGALTYNYRDGTVLMSDVAEKTITSLDLKTMRSTQLVDSQLGKVVAMEYDFLGHNLYWCDFERQTVEVMSLTTSQRAVVVRDLDGDHPASLALLPEDGIMFVGMTSEQHSHIDIFLLTGRGRSHAVEGLHGQPSALAVHRGLRRLFWSDDLTGEIESTDVAGGDRRKWRSLPGEPISLAVLGNDLFFTNSYSPYLHWGGLTAMRDTMTKTKLNVENSLPAMKLLAVEAPPNGSHACGTDNGGCSHVCFAVKNGVECGCPLGMRLRNDERRCAQPTKCADKEFKCSKDELCIPMALRCNGHKECPSGEDEEKCGEPSCPPHSFTCGSGECVPSHGRCDGSKDCKDGSDEEGCAELLSCEKNGQFACASGECLDRRFVCDGKSQCRDGSDELNCEDSTCGPDEFTCASRQCLPAKWECDGAPDCVDGSDEHKGCLLRLPCKASDFKCASGRCVDKRVVCDGDDDCGDGSDEANCEEKSRAAVCPHDHFRCESKPQICLPPSARCNGTSECPHHEDEADCGCPGDTLTCKPDGRCLPKSWQCDGTADCSDGSDEEGCDQPKSTTAPPPREACREFTCGSGKCVYYTRVCDGRNDCEDGSDEGGRCDTSCEKGSNPCSHVCNHTPLGPRCSCNPGYVLRGDGHSCRDLDECTETRGGSPCSQLCRNTPGSYICSCAKGYMLRADSRTCKATGGALEVVLVTSDEVHKISLRTGELEIVAANSGLQVSGLAVDARKKQVFWSSAISGRLSRLSMDSGVEKRLEQLVERPKKMAVDWLTGNVYVVDQTHFPTIKVCSVEAERCAKIFTAVGAKDITSIAVNPLSGHVFWAATMAERGSVPRSEIWRARMDGANATALVSSGLALVSAISLDLVVKELFWADQSRGVIEVAALDGSNRRELPFNNVQRPVGVGVFEDHVYYMAGSSGKLSKCERRYPHACEYVELHAYDAVLFALVQQALQPDMASLCVNSTCSHLCVLSSAEDTTCLCEDGTRCEDGKSRFPTAPSTPSRGSGSTVAALLVTSLLLVAGVLAWYFCYSRRANKGLFNLSLHFQNAAYGLQHQPEAGVFSVPPSESLDPNEHQYSNPVFRSAAAAGESLQRTFRKLTAPSAPPAPTGRADLPLDSREPAFHQDSDCESPVDSRHEARLIPLDK